jgi:hypothetical protein
MPPSGDQNESSLDRLNKRLYQDKPLPTVAPDALNLRERRDTPHAWQNTEMPRAPKKPRPSFAKLFFIGAVLFFVIAGAIAAWLLLSGDRSVSTNNLDVSITGPTSIAAGDTVPLALTVVNRNPSALNSADLTMTFPDGTRSADDVTQAYPRYEEQFDSIPAGGTITRTVKAVLFGEQGQSITIPVEITYRISGSNAVFVKQESYTLTVTTAPLSVSVDAPSEAVSGQPFTIDAQVRSNATGPIPNAVLQAEYPFGFTVTNATPAAGGSGSFSLGTLQPGDTKDVKITGTLSGTDAQDRVFHFTAGTADSSGSLSLAYTSKDASVAIAAPFLATTLSLNGSSDSLSVPAGQTVNATLSYTNTLAEAVTNASISVAFQGNALDSPSVRTNQGFFQSSNNTIVFDSTTIPALASIPPGGTGTFSFTFSTQSAGVKNPTLAAVVSIQGQRLDQANVPQSVNATVSNTIRVLSNLGISQQATHATGSIENRGPVPPTPGQQTTYTIIWNAANSSNDIAGATAAATLPSYVTFTGVSAPSGAFTYDSASRKVTWNIGDLSAGANKQASFQVSLTPSTSQVGTSPALVGPVMLSAYDRFAATQVSATSGSVTTDTPGDPGYQPGSGTVR